MDAYLIIWQGDSNKINEFDDLRRLVEYYHKELKLIKYDDTRVKAVSSLMTSSFIKRYSTIVFSIFETFKLLNEYKNVLVLDSDLLIRAPIDDIKNQGMLAYRTARPINSALREPKEEFHSKYTPNAGVVFLNDKIPNYNDITEKCYDILKEYADDINLTYEEVVLGILFSRLGIKSSSDMQEYNYTIARSNKNCLGGLSAKIIHYINVEKPWKSAVVRRITPEYTENILLLDRILKKEGTNPAIAGSTFYDSVRMNFCLEFNRQIYEALINTIPRTFYPQLVLQYSKLRFHSFLLGNRIYFDVCYNPEWCNLKDKYFATAKASKIKFIKIGIVILNFRDEFVARKEEQLLLSLSKIGLNVDINADKLTAYKEVAFEDLCSSFSKFSYDTEKAIKEISLMTIDSKM